MKQLLLLFVILFFVSSTNSLAQGVGINETGAAPDNSALLDLDSPDKGFLITRVDTANIITPTFGLMTLAPIDSCLYLYSGAKWMGMGGVGSNCFCSFNNSACPVPSAITASATPNPICEGNTLTLTGGATGATSWLWTGPNGFTSNLQSPTLPNITTADAGDYTLTASNACGSAQSTNTTTVIVDNLPAMPGAISGTAVQCPSLAGQTYSITAVPGASSYTWTVPVGWTITSGQGTTSITVTTGALGQNGSISVNSTSSCGTSADRTLTVKVLEIVGIRVKIGMYAYQSPGQNNVTLTFNQAHTGWTDMNCDNCYTCTGTGNNMIMTYSGTGACVAYNGMWRDYTFTTLPTSVNISMIGTGVHSYNTNFFWLYNDGSISTGISTCNNSSPYYYTNWNESYSCTFSAPPSCP